MVLRPYGDVGSQHTATAARGLLPSHHAVKGTTSLTRAPACHSQFLLHSERSAAISSAVSFRFFFVLFSPEEPLCPRRRRRAGPRPGAGPVLWPTAASPFPVAAAASAILGNRS